MILAMPRRPGNYPADGGAVPGMWATIGRTPRWAGLHGGSSEWGRSRHSWPGVPTKRRSSPVVRVDVRVSRAPFVAYPGRVRADPNRARDDASGPMLAAILAATWAP